MEISSIQKNIMDNTAESIEYYYTKLNNNYVLHIHNPNKIQIKIHKNNRKFYEKLLKIMFDKNNFLHLGLNQI